MDITQQQLEEITLRVSQDVHFELNFDEAIALVRGVVGALPKPEPVGVFANVNEMIPGAGARWEHMMDEAYNPDDGYIYLYKGCIAALPASEHKPVARAICSDWVSTGEGTWIGTVESHLPLQELTDLFTHSPDSAARIAELERSNAQWESSYHEQQSDFLSRTVSLQADVAELEKQRDGLVKDAERWAGMSGLMFLGNVFAEQDEDGGYSITLDPAENLLGVTWNGNSPEEAIDAAIASAQEGGAA